MWFRCYDNFDLNVLLTGRKKKNHLLFNTALVAIFLVFVNMPVTSRRPCWWSRTKAFLSYGN